MLYLLEIRLIIQGASMIVRMLLLVLVSTMIAACGTGATPSPTPLPRPTSTPISTPLPDVPTAIPAGFDSDNPLQLVIVPADLEGATANEAEFEALLAERSGIVVDVLLVETNQEALTLLCNSDRGTVSAAWLDGFGYIAASYQECGLALLGIDRGVDDQSNTGEAGLLLANIEFAETGISSLTTRPFCRINYSDAYSWFIPTLIFGQAEIDVSTLEVVVDKIDYARIITDIATGECAAGGVPRSAWELAIDTTPALADTVTVLAESPEFAHGVVVFPFASSLEVINAVVDALITLDVDYGRAIAPAPEATAEATAESTEEVAPTATPTAEPEAESTEEASNRLLLPFFGDGVFIRVQPSDFAEVDAFLRDSGFDFELLGQ